jgi:pimeloyl-ACP methyl ester carboxylesterase
MTCAAAAKKRFGQSERRKSSFDPMRSGATDVTGAIVPDSGHWIMEENPDATVKLVRAFLDKS